MPLAVPLVPVVLFLHVILLIDVLLLLLASGLDKGALIAQSTLTVILTSTLWIGVVSAVLLFLFAGRIRQALASNPSEL